MGYFFTKNLGQMSTFEKIVCNCNYILFTMYINNLIQYDQINDLQLNIKGCEDIRIKLCESNVIVSAIYRHPKNNNDDFTTALLNTTYEKLSDKIIH